MRRVAKLKTSVYLSIYFLLTMIAAWWLAAIRLHNYVLTQFTFLMDKIIYTLYLCVDIPCLLYASTHDKDVIHPYFPIISDKVREHIWRDFDHLDHSSMQNFSESLISLGLHQWAPSSVQTTGFWWDLSLETEKTIAEHGCCFYLPISVWIDGCLE